MSHVSSDLRRSLREAQYMDEPMAVTTLMQRLGWSSSERDIVARRGAALVRQLRESETPELMESFLAEYGLSTREGVALMCLAEALLRVPDEETIDALIVDKIAPSDWGQHLGKATSSLVNASTWALMLTGRMLGDEDEGVVGALHAMVRRLGEPVVRRAVSQAMREMGHQFVLGRTIEEALERGGELELAGYTYSYDMLGEAARTLTDARRYHLSYAHAIASLAAHCTHASIRDNPGISVKLSALHERYEYAQRERVMTQLVARTRSLAMLACSANMGFNIDAEEADRLDLSLDVIEAVLSDPTLAAWDGFGVVVQAYGKRAPWVIEWLYELAVRLDRRIMVRLVKGAYWDAEIKRAQVEGLEGFPVFTRKASTDVSFLACAKMLLAMTDRIYPQFATHNAHTVSAVLHMAGERDDYEFQRLHGMGENLHQAVREAHTTRCRIYAPVGAHRDLLAYLVRRLLENGANSSFVHQIVDTRIAPEDVASDPIAELEALGDELINPVVAAPHAIYGPGRLAARGFDRADPLTIDPLEQARSAFRSVQWHAGPVCAQHGQGVAHSVVNPANRNDIVGEVIEVSAEQVDDAIAKAKSASKAWAACSVEQRAQCLYQIADRYEDNAPELFALLAREAGKTLPDAIAELREAVDFCRYYALEVLSLQRDGTRIARGVFVCISPWNFPLAIFTGQIVAALVTGNCVLAKPAEQTPLIAARAVALMHEAGIPREVLALLPGDGARVGGALTSDARIDGVCFTGSTATAKLIQQSMARSLDSSAPLIAETGGLNAMVVDSSALPEQAVRDIIASAFQSAGQRCSALRMLYVQADVEQRLLTMLTGAMDALDIGDPWALSTDVGPVIDDVARDHIDAHCARLDEQGRCIKRLQIPARLSAGSFVAPALYRVEGIHELKEEIFGPVLHVARFEIDALHTVIDAINDAGYGLTFGLHTRVDSRVQEIVDRIHCGNVYVNRNQIGAVVGVQPFGGEGLSGTGPKAGGPHYLRAFTRGDEPALAIPAHLPVAQNVSMASLEQQLQAAQKLLVAWHANGQWAMHVRSLLRTVTDEVRECCQQAVALASAVDLSVQDLPGPTGESNRLSLHPRGVVLCLGDAHPGSAINAALQAVSLGCAALVSGDPLAVDLSAQAKRFDVPLLALAQGQGIDPDHLVSAKPLAVVSAPLTHPERRQLANALALRAGPIVPLIDGTQWPERYLLERVLSVDTTAAGGNATLLAQAG